MRFPPRWLCDSAPPVLLFLLLARAPLLLAQEVPPPALADTEARVMTSSVTGRTYQVTVALPRGYGESGKTYPVLYTVDANGQFGSVVEAARAMRFEDLIPELIIVGIGYPVGRPWNALSPRAVDLTPTRDQPWEEYERVTYPQFPAPEGSGGAPGFLRFLTEELIPAIEAEYRTEQDDRALYGHSFGGLFGTYALLHGNGTFRKFIIGSPSYWWDHRVTFDMEEAHAATHDALPARVFFSVGILEEPEGDEELAPYRMVSNLHDFEAVLAQRGYRGFEWTSVYFPEETHTSVIPATISRGLRYIYGDDSEPTRLLDSGEAFGAPSHLARETPPDVRQH
jgi:predicted alpha/beta superfamily hydrolase